MHLMSGGKVPFHYCVGINSVARNSIGGNCGNSWVGGGGKVAHYAGINYYQR